MARNHTIVLGQAVLAAAWLCCATPVSATILTFVEGSGNFVAINQAYGDNVTGNVGSFSYEIGNGWTPNVLAEYSTRSPGAGYPLHAANMAVYNNWSPGQGYAASTLTDGKIAEIALIPEPDYAVTINSFQLMGWNASSTTANPIQILNDDRSVVLWNVPGGQSVGARTDFFPSYTGAAGATLRLQFGTTWNLAIDNLNFDQALIQSIMPEPGSLALLAMGALTLLRRRRQ